MFAASTLCMLQHSIRSIFSLIDISPSTSDEPSAFSGGVIQLAHNFTCGRQAIMGDIVRTTSPYLFPFVIEYSLIAAGVLIAMWKNIGRNPR